MVIVSCFFLSFIYFRKECVIQTSGVKDAGWNVLTDWDTMVLLSSSFRNFRIRRLKSGNGHDLAIRRLELGQSQETDLGQEEDEYSCEWNRWNGGSAIMLFLFALINFLLIWNLIV